MKKVTEYRLKKIASDFDSIKLCSSGDCAKYMRQFFSDDLEIYESFFLVLLNRQNNVIGWVKISQGGVSGTVCDPVLIAKYAINSLAAGVILCHNHPSGNLQPSNADNEMTRKVSQGLALFGIKVVDHIILTADSYYSYADEGNL